MNNKKTLLGTLAALGANIIFGFSFLFSTMALDAGAHPLVIISVRFTLAFLILTLLIAFKIVKVNFKGKRLLPVICMGIAQPLLYFIFETYGLKMVSSAISGVVISLVPVFVMICYALFFKGRPTFLQIICCVLSVLGVIAISILSDGGEVKFSITGLVCLLLAVACSTVFNILSNRSSGEFSPIERTYVMFAIGTVGFNAVSFVVLKGGYISEIITSISSVEFVIAVVYLAVISSICAFLMYNFATANIDMVRASSFSGIISVVSMLAGIFILREKVSIPQVICCIIIILSVYGVNYIPKSSVKNNSEDLINDEIK